MYETNLHTVPSFGEIRSVVNFKFYFNFILGASFVSNDLDKGAGLIIIAFMGILCVYGVWG